MIYVTHDQTEALTFAQKVVVMHEGRVVQMGTPEELFETPAHTFVGYFIGSPGMNLLDAEITRVRGTYWGTSRLPLGAAYGPMTAGRTQIGIRPDYVIDLGRRSAGDREAGRGCGTPPHRPGRSSRASPSERDPARRHGGPRG